MRLVRVVLAIISTVFAMVMAVPIAVLGLPFWVVSSLARILDRVLQPKFVPWRDLIEFEPTVGWKPRVNLDTHYLARGGDICHIRTDAEGWPGQTILDECELVVIGDSFAFGYGVDTEASFAEVNSNLRIKGIGAPGYNMVQELLLLRQLSSSLHDKVVVWFLCLENDLYDNLRPNKPNFYRTPFVRHLNGVGTYDWEIVTNHVCSTKWYYSSDQRKYYPMLAELCTPGVYSKMAYSACNFLISEGKSVCRQAGAQLVIVTIPNKNQLSQPGVEFLISQLVDATDFDPDFPDKQIASICTNLGVPFLSAKDYLEMNDYKEHDTHWTEQGHRRVAKLLERLRHNFVLNNRA